MWLKIMYQLASCILLKGFVTKELKYLHSYKANIVAMRLLAIVIAMFPFCDIIVFKTIAIV